MSGDLGPCTYTVRQPLGGEKKCGEPAHYEVQCDGRKFRICTRHARPEYHPPDLHKQLPGIIRRALRGAR